MNKDVLTELIKSKASELGFDNCGISKARFLENEAGLLENWLKKNMNGKMSYMERNFDKRLDPRLLVDGAKSVISVIINYYPTESDRQNDSSDKPKISKYAWGEDYHFVVKRKLKELEKFISGFAEHNSRYFVDSAPIMDKVWASNSGLGWIGKNSNLITKKRGSYFFVGELITDLELVYDNQTTDHCGSCTACIDSCPTNAIVEPYVVDGSKCISYFSIELKDNIPTKYAGKFENWVFGCDICQDVCPWNRFANSHSESAFKKNKSIDMTFDEWEALTEPSFKEKFNDSPILRTGFEGMVRNMKFLKKDYE